MRVIWAPRAIARAAEIAAHIAADRPNAAGAWVEKLFTTARDLKNHPKRGRKVPELGRPEIREILHGAYRVVYRLDSKRLVILTVRHGRRQWDPAEIEPED